MALEITGANRCHALSFGLDAVFLISSINTGHERELSSVPHTSGPHGKGMDSAGDACIVSQPEHKPSKDFHCLLPVLQGS